MEKSIFNELNAINVSDKTERKGKFTYLSWAFAWGELKKIKPDSSYKIYKNNDGLNYHHDGRTGWVEVGVTVEGLEHVVHLPIMDNQNRSMPLNQITSFHVNKSIQRAFTKAISMHGLGLYIYAGEDLPEDEAPKKSSANNKEVFVSLYKMVKEPDQKVIDFYNQLESKSESDIATGINRLNQIIKEQG